MMSGEMTGLRRLLDPAVALYVSAFSKGVHADVDIVVDDVVMGMVVMAAYEQPWNGGRELVTVEDLSLYVSQLLGPDDPIDNTSRENFSAVKISGWHFYCATLDGNAGLVIEAPNQKYRACYIARGKVTDDLVALRSGQCLCIDAGVSVQLPVNTATSDTIVH